MSKGALEGRSQVTVQIKTYIAVGRFQLPPIFKIGMVPRSYPEGCEEVHACILLGDPHMQSGVFEPALACWR